jgi:hypothetical protein
LTNIPEIAVEISGLFQCIGELSTVYLLATADSTIRRLMSGSPGSQLRADKQRISQEASVITSLDHYTV